MRIPHGISVAVLALALVPVLAAVPSHAVASTCHGQVATIQGTAGDDVIVGTPLPDVVSLGAGNDRFSDLGSNDLVCGGGGHDILSGDAGNDLLDGGSGKDKIAGGPGDDRILGGDGNDEMTPGDGNDKVRAGKGDDYVAEGGGNDKIAGGPGKDYVTYLYWNRSIRVAGAREVFGAGRDSLGAVETIEGTAKADVLRGTQREDDLRGGGGRDRIYGLGGNDLLFVYGGLASGGPGVDFIQASGRTTANGGADSDQIVLLKGPVKGLGGPGADQFRVAHPRFTGSADGQGDANQLDFSSHRRGVTVKIGAGRAWWRGGRMTLRNIDNTLGTFRADTLIGGPGNDYMDGLRGPDTLRGLGGNDFLIGKGGFDKADGGPGWDICLTESRKACP